MKKFVIGLIVFAILIGLFWGLLKNINTVNAHTETTDISQQQEGEEMPLFEVDSCEKSVEKISGHEFWCYIRSCFDIDTYNYNPKTNTYTVDYMFDISESNNRSVYKSPYDNGYITHLIFETSVSPSSKKIFSAKYKGFITSKFVKDKEDGGYYNELLNLYYDNNPRIIPDLDLDIEYFRTLSEDPELFLQTDYSLGILKCLPKQLKI